MKTTNRITILRTPLSVGLVLAAALALLAQPCAIQAASPDDKTWIVQNSGTKDHIRSISGNTLGGLFLSAGHTIQQYNPTSGTWSELESWSNFTMPWGYDKTSSYTLISSINGQIAAVRQGGTGRVAFFDGTIWSSSTTTSSTEPARAIFTTGVGDGGRTLAARNGNRISRFNGTTYASSTGPTTEASTIVTIHGTGDENIWAGGTGGTLVHSTDGGRTWENVTSETINDIRAVFTLGANTIITATAAQVRISTTGGTTTWNYHGFDSSIVINAIYAEAINKIWVVGNSGLAMYFNGSTWTSFADQLPGLGNTNLFSIHGIDGQLWIGGANGLLFTTAIPEHGTYATVLGFGALATVLSRRKGRHTEPAAR